MRGQCTFNHPEHFGIPLLHLLGKEASHCWGISRCYTCRHFHKRGLPPAAAIACSTCHPLTWCCSCAG